MKRTLAEWLTWQETLHPRTIELGLERVRSVAQKLGVHQFSCPVITVGGTNGKGSSVALLESILSAGGYRVGAFTSPHLIHYNERIRITGQLATDEQLVSAFERIDAARGDISLTFFEFNTLAALVLFHEAALDVIVLEVGLGGRLDAVNIIDSDVALLTSVGLDHCDWLGATLEAIGKEKAGIFRKGRMAVLGHRKMPQSVFDSAYAIGASVRSADLSLTEGLPKPALEGGQQIFNAAAVLTVLDELRARLPLTREQIAQGLRSVKLQGRFEVIPGKPQWIFDVAHNPEAAAVLAANLKAREHSGRTIAIVGILADKDVPAVVEPLLPLVDVWIAVTLSEPRGTTAAELIERCSVLPEAKIGKWKTADSVVEACEFMAKRARPRDRIVVFGSFHTVGPALQWRLSQTESDAGA